MIKVLLADDSAFMRKVISDIINKFTDVTVTTVVRNGQLAVTEVQRQVFDLVILDVEMPVMDGLTALANIKAISSVPVMMLSALSNQELTIKALELGALDFIEKPVDIQNIDQAWLRMLEEKINTSLQFNGHPLEFMAPTVKGAHTILAPKAIVIGASTGGPKALLQLIKALPKQINMPIFIVQHMPKGFTTHFAHRLNDFTTTPVYEATDGMLVENAIYLAPGDYHMEVIGQRLKLNNDSKLHGTRPAVDYLFKSAAQMYGSHLVGILLTGMGHDGAQGMATISSYGGYNIAQDEATCVVYGMPKSAVALNVVNESLSLDDISIKLNQIVKVV